MHSMTGMGRAKGKIGSSHFLVELKSVNHKFCEVFTRLPNRFQPLELQITQFIKKKIARGKIDVSFIEERAEGEMTVNLKALRAYHRFLSDIKTELKLKEPVTLAHLQAGSSFWMVRESDLKRHAPAMQLLVDKAIKDLLRMREREGKNLKKQIQFRLKNLEELHRQIGLRRGTVLEAYQQKLHKRVESLLSEVEVDQSKLANEIAFFADRSDISEELERLESHFKQMRELLESKEPCGRPLDFLIQEINREWNTIGSKSQDVSIAHWIVQAKSELEKLREQIQNIE